MPRMIAGIALVAVLGAARSGHAQAAAPRYPSMAPIEQYLMPRDAEIALARSAAPVSVSRDAEVLVLGRKGYEIAVQGSNGFVCAVERSWESPFNDSQFWNQKIRSPLCFNPPAAQTVLPAVEKRTAMVLAGLPKTQVIDGLNTGFERKELVGPAPGAMSYMMSKDAYPNDNGNLSHVMFFEPLAGAKVWGAGLPGSVIYAFDNPEDRYTLLIVPMTQWSDGVPVKN
jgi:hypothetical protein